MDLILWRHAEAEDGLIDQTRALTDKGQRQAKKMAAFLAPRLPADTRILVSPALRTQQTAAALTANFVTEPAINTSATAHSALQAADWNQHSGTVLLVGHQPWLGEIAAYLMTGKTAYWAVKRGAVWWFSSRQDGAETDISLRLVISPAQL